METRFGDANPNFTAQTKLEKLKQGQKSVHTHNSMFNKYSGLTGYNEVALVNAYYGGLNDDILHKRFNKERVPWTSMAFNELLSTLKTSSND